MAGTAKRAARTAAIASLAFSFMGDSSPSRLLPEDLVVS